MARSQRPASLVHYRTDRACGWRGGALGSCRLPIYLEISRLHRCVTMVARGDLDGEEIAGACGKLADAGVSHFAKLVDTAASTSGVTQAQMEQIVASLRGRSPEAARGPVAFLIDPERPGFAPLYAQTQDSRRVHLFTSIHKARNWLTETQSTGWQSASTEAPPAGDPWSAPEREAMLFRGGQRRAVPVRQSRPAYAQG